MTQATAASQTDIDGSPASPPLCKHWARKKSCLYHDEGKCKFSHPPDIVPCSLSPKRSKGGRLQTRNDMRVAKFRAFIASHVNLQEANILDVAGGKGELAFQLLNLSNARECHVVDPRPLSLSKYQNRLQKGFYHRSASILDKNVVTSVGDEERPVGHLRCFFSHELWAFNGDQKDSDDNDDFDKNCTNTQAWTWPPKGNHNNHSSEENDLDETPSDAPSETPSFQHASTTTKRCTLIVGMHPDQAAEAIVDAALSLGVSFFVVPCCTYSQEFPHRRLKNGRLVTRYEDLLDYLQNKSPDIQRQVLPFEGKNVCLYRIVSS